VIISDQSVRRPVLATVVSALLVILGLAALSSLPVRQYPDVDSPVVSIETSYRGASAEVIETKVTQVIEDVVAGIEGIEKLTSSSRDERSDIRVEFSLVRDIDEAANDIRDRVSRIVDQLPSEADPPEIAKVDNTGRAVMYLNLTSDRHSGLELTDFADRYLIDRFSTVPGVARVQISGARRYAMRIWMSREALAARGLTVADVESALRAENVELPAGRLESETREFTLRTDTGFTVAGDFERLVVGRGPDGQRVTLGEVADVRIGAENERSIARANGVDAVSLAIEQLSRANSVAVSREVRKEMETIGAELPEGMVLAVNYDRAEFIEASMREVYRALFIAITLVLVVIYLFLGSFRVTLIPAVVVPVSVIATFIVMAALGYTINILTLLGLVLAIGLVVDDAIVVLENIYRRIEDGQRPLLAALEGANEIGFAVIATTLVLVAVFVPLSFIQGDIGRHPDADAVVQNAAPQKPRYRSDAHGRQCIPPLRRCLPTGTGTRDRISLAGGRGCAAGQWSGRLDDAHAARGVRPGRGSRRILHPVAGARGLQPGIHGWLHAADGAHTAGRNGRLRFRAAIPHAFAGHLGRRRGQLGACHRATRKLGSARRERPGDRRAPAGAPERTSGGALLRFARQQPRYARGRAPGRDGHRRPGLRAVAAVARRIAGCAGRGARAGQPR
jgi:hypothetical protein